MLSKLPSLISEYNDCESIHLGFVGDVMIGRGIDAVLPFSVDGTLYESCMKDASLLDRRKMRAVFCQSRSFRNQDSAFSGLILWK